MKARGLGGLVVVAPLLEPHLFFFLLLLGLMQPELRDLDALDEVTEWRILVTVQQLNAINL